MAKSFRDIGQDLRSKPGIRLPNGREMDRLVIVQETISASDYAAYQTIVQATANAAISVSSPTEILATGTYAFTIGGESFLLCCGDDNGDVRLPEGIKRSEAVTRIFEHFSNLPGYITAQLDSGAVAIFNESGSELASSAQSPFLLESGPCFKLDQKVAERFRRNAPHPDCPWLKVVNVESSGRDDHNVNLSIFYRVDLDALASELNISADLLRTKTGYEITEPFDNYAYPNVKWTFEILNPETYVRAEEGTRHPWILSAILINETRTEQDGSHFVTRFYATLPGPIQTVLVSTSGVSEKVILRKAVYSSAQGVAPAPPSTDHFTLSTKLEKDPEHPNIEWWNVETEKFPGPIFREQIEAGDLTIQICRRRVLLANPGTIPAASSITYQKISSKLVPDTENGIAATWEVEYEVLPGRVVTETKIQGTKTIISVKRRVLFDGTDTLPAVANATLLTSGKTQLENGPVGELTALYEATPGSVITLTETLGNRTITTLIQRVNFATPGSPPSSSGTLLSRKLEPTEDNAIGIWTVVYEATPGPVITVTETLGDRVITTSTQRVAMDNRGTAPAGPASSVLLSASIEDTENGAIGIWKAVYETVPGPIISLEKILGDRVITTLTQRVSRTTPGAAPSTTGTLLSKDLKEVENGAIGIWEVVYEATPGPVIIVEKVLGDRTITTLTQRVNRANPGSAPVASGATLISKDLREAENGAIGIWECVYESTPGAIITVTSVLGDRTIIDIRQRVSLASPGDCPIPSNPLAVLLEKALREDEGGAIGIWQARYEIVPGPLVGVVKNHADREIHTYRRRVSMALRDNEPPVPVGHVLLSKDIREDEGGAIGVWIVETEKVPGQVVTVTEEIGSRIITTKTQRVSMADRGDAPAGPASSVLLSKELDEAENGAIGIWRVKYETLPGPVLTTDTTAGNIRTYRKTQRVLTASPGSAPSAPSGSTVTRSTLAQTDNDLVSEWQVEYEALPGPILSTDINIGTAIRKRQTQRILRSANTAAPSAPSGSFVVKSELQATDNDLIAEWIVESEALPGPIFVTDTSAGNIQSYRKTQRVAVAESGTAPATPSGSVVTKSELLATENNLVAQWDVQYEVLPGPTITTTKAQGIKDIVFLSKRVEYNAPGTAPVAEGTSVLTSELVLIGDGPVGEWRIVCEATPGDTITVTETLGDRTIKTLTKRTDYATPGTAPSAAGTLLSSKYEPAEDAAIGVWTVVYEVTPGPEISSTREVNGRILNVKRQRVDRATPGTAPSVSGVLISSELEDTENGAIGVWNVVAEVLPGPTVTTPIADGGRELVRITKRVERTSPGTMPESLGYTTLKAVLEPTDHPDIAEWNVDAEILPGPVVSSKKVEGTREIHIFTQRFAFADNTVAPSAPFGSIVLSSDPKITENDLVREWQVICEKLPGPVTRTKETRGTRTIEIVRQRVLTATPGTAPAASGAHVTINSKLADTENNLVSEWQVEYEIIPGPVLIDTITEGNRQIEVTKKRVLAATPGTAPTPSSGYTALSSKLVEDEDGLLATWQVEAEVLPGPILSTDINIGTAIRKRQTQRILRAANTAAPSAPSGSFVVKSELQATDNDLIAEWNVESEALPGPIFVTDTSAGNIQSYRKTQRVAVAESGTAPATPSGSVVTKSELLATENNLVAQWDVQYEVLPGPTITTTKAQGIKDIVFLSKRVEYNAPGTAPVAAGTSVLTSELVLIGDGPVGEWRIVCEATPGDTITVTETLGDRTIKTLTKRTDYATPGTEPSDTGTLLSSKYEPAEDAAIGVWTVVYEVTPGPEISSTREVNGRILNVKRQRVARATPGTAPSVSGVLLSSELEDTENGAIGVWNVVAEVLPGPTTATTAQSGQRLTTVLKRRVLTATPGTMPTAIGSVVTRHRLQDTDHPLISEWVVECENLPTETATEKVLGDRILKVLTKRTLYTSPGTPPTWPSGVLLSKDFSETEEGSIGIWEAIYELTPGPVVLVEKVLGDRIITTLTQRVDRANPGDAPAVVGGTLISKDLRDSDNGAIGIWDVVYESTPGSIIEVSSTLGDRQIIDMRQRVNLATPGICPAPANANAVLLTKELDETADGAIGIWRARYEVVPGPIVAVVKNHADREIHTYRRRVSMALRDNEPPVPVGHVLLSKDIREDEGGAIGIWIVETEAVPGPVITVDETLGNRTITTSTQRVSMANRGSPPPGPSGSVLLSSNLSETENGAIGVWRAVYEALPGPVVMVERELGNRILTNLTKRVSFTNPGTAPTASGAVLLSKELVELENGAVGEWRCTYESVPGDAVTVTREIGNRTIKTTRKRVDFANPDPAPTDTGVLISKDLSEAENGAIGIWEVSYEQVPGPIVRTEKKLNGRKLLTLTRRVDFTLQGTAPVMDAGKIVLSEELGETENGAIGVWEVIGEELPGPETVTEINDGGRKLKRITRRVSRTATGAEPSAIGYTTTKAILADTEHPDIAEWQVEAEELPGPIIRQKADKAGAIQQIVTRRVLTALPGPAPAHDLAGNVKTLSEELAQTENPDISIWRVVYEVLFHPEEDTSTKSGADFGQVERTVKLASAKTAATDKTVSISHEVAERDKNGTPIQYRNVEEKANIIAGNYAQTRSIRPGLISTTYRQRAESVTPRLNAPEYSWSVANRNSEGQVIAYEETYTETQPDAREAGTERDHRVMAEIETTKRYATSPQVNTTSGSSRLIYSDPEKSIYEISESRATAKARTAGTTIDVRPGVRLSTTESFSADSTITSPTGSASIAFDDGTTVVYGKRETSATPIGGNAGTEKEERPYLSITTVNTFSASPDITAPTGSSRVSFTDGVTTVYQVSNQTATAKTGNSGTEKEELPYLSRTTQKRYDTSSDVATPTGSSTLVYSDRSTRVYQLSEETVTPKTGNAGKEKSRRIYLETTRDKRYSVTPDIVGKNGSSRILYDNGAVKIYEVEEETSTVTETANGQDKQVLPYVTLETRKRFSTSDSIATPTGSSRVVHHDGETTAFEIEEVFPTVRASDAGTAKNHRLGYRVETNKRYSASDSISTPVGSSRPIWTDGETTVYEIEEETGFLVPLEFISRKSNNPLYQKTVTTRYGVAPISSRDLWEASVVWTDGTLVVYEINETVTTPNPPRVYQNVVTATVPSVLLALNTMVFPAKNGAQKTTACPILEEGYTGQFPARITEYFVHEAPDADSFTPIIFRPSQIFVDGTRAEIRIGEVLHGNLVFVESIGDSDPFWESQVNTWTFPATDPPAIPTGWHPFARDVSPHEDGYIVRDVEIKYKP